MTETAEQYYEAEREAFAAQEIAEMQLMSADEIVQKAGADFDAWCASHAEEVETLDMLERIDLYAVDAAWHSRETAV